MSFIIIPQARKMSFVLKRFIFLMRPHCHRLIVYPNTPVARALLCSLLLGRSGCSSFWFCTASIRVTLCEVCVQGGQ